MPSLDAQSIIDKASSSEDDIKREVREKTDLFGTNGYYIPFAVSLSPRVMEALNESFIYGRTFYNDYYIDDVAAFVAQKERDNASVSETSLVPGMDLKVN